MGIGHCGCCLVVSSLRVRISDVFGRQSCVPQSVSLFLHIQCPLLLVQRPLFQLQYR